jgi:hypothetical protein
MLSNLIHRTLRTSKRLLGQIERFDIASGTVSTKAISAQPRSTGLFSSQEFPLLLLPARSLRNYNTSIVDDRASLRCQPSATKSGRIDRI